jgi:hypothetical protein
MVVLGEALQVSSQRLECPLGHIDMMPNISMPSVNSVVEAARGSGT